MPNQTRELQTVGFGLRAKILVWAFMAMAIGTVSVSFFTLWAMYYGIEEVSRSRINAEVEATAHQIERNNQFALSIPKTVALAQANGMFGQRVPTMEFLRTILEAYPVLTGIGVGYEPNADTLDLEFLRANRSGVLSDGTPLTNGLGATGRFLPYWFRDREDRAVLRLTPLVDMDTSYYYQGNRNLFYGRSEDVGIAPSQIEKNSPLWWDTGRSQKVTTWDDGLANFIGIMTEPYIYEGKFIVEQAFPIIIDGQFKGVVGADRALRDLQEYIWSQKPYETARFYVLSQRGRIIVSPHDSTISYDPQSMSDQELDKITEQGDRIDSVEMGEFLNAAYASDENHPAQIASVPGHRPFYYASYRLPTKLGGWTVILLVDQYEVMAPFRTARNISIAILAVALLAMAVILIWIANAIARRVKLAAEAARRVAEGDLTVSVSRDSNDETGQLLGDIGNMVEDLNSLVGQVKRSSVELISTATQISAASKQQEASVNNFGSSTNEVTAAVKEISATSQELVKTMDDVTEVAAETANLADEGRTSLGGMEQAMRTLAGATSSIGEKLALINEKSNKIGSVITTITKVSDQTNLLSLNAAIEAEKAGEYGLGFAVVAREIRRLADQTASATLDIEQMVVEMQAAVSSGVMEMEKFSGDVRQGVEETVLINTQLTQIIEQVQALTPRFETVHEGMQSQSMGAGQISEAMVALTEAAHGSTVSLKAFNQAAEKLQNAVNGLKEEVAKFKVK